jgi:integrase/recombinase XerD
MDLVPESRASARGAEPEARSVARWRERGDTPVDAAELWLALGACPFAVRWLELQRDLGRSPRTIDAYARSLSDYLRFCDRHGVDVIAAGRAEIAGYVRDLRERPGRRGANVIALDSGAGLSNATLQLRITVIRLFYDFLVEERVRDRNPVGRGYRAGDGRGGRRGLIPRVEPLPWIPTDAQWQALLEVAAGESFRNRLMLALAYDAALRREEPCLLATDDLDPAHRTITVRAETTKTRRSRVVPYSVVAGRLLSGYLAHRRQLTSARESLFVSESPRNRAAAITAWTWSKVVRSIAVRAGVPAFSTHTLRHLCLTDLARSGWELMRSRCSPGISGRRRRFATSICPAGISPSGSRAGCRRSTPSGSRRSARSSRDPSRDLLRPQRAADDRRARRRAAQRGSR